MPAGLDPRQLAAAMKRMGIATKEIAGVEEVVVRTGDREYRFRRPQVSVMTAQGTETWQVVGRPTETRRTDDDVQPTGSLAEHADAAEAAAAARSPPPAASPSSYAPSAEDVATVAQASGRTPAQARQALVESGGDLAQAILALGG